MGGGGVRVDVNVELKFFVKIQKKKCFFWGVRVGPGGRGGGREGRVVGVRVDVIEELKFLGKLKKKIGEGGGGCPGGGGGRLVGGSGWM